MSGVAELAAAALKVFTRQELQAMSEPCRLSFLVLVDRRLKQDGPPPTPEELQGIRELVMEYLWHPALDAIRSPGGAAER